MRKAGGGEQRGVAVASEFQLLLDFMHAKLVHNKFAAAPVVVVVPGDHGHSRKCVAMCE